MKCLWLCLLSFSLQAYAADNVVTEKGKQFSAPTIKIKKGDTVTFKNADTTSHNIYSPGPQNKFPLKLQAEGADVQVKFDEAGKSEIQCGIHPNMKMTVEVE